MANGLCLRGPVSGLVSACRIAYVSYLDWALHVVWPLSHLVSLINGLYLEESADPG